MQRLSAREPLRQTHILAKVLRQLTRSLGYRVDAIWEKREMRRDLLLE